MPAVFEGAVDAQVTVPTSVTISVTTNGGGPTTVTITAGTYFLRELLDQIRTDLTAQRPVTAGSWTVSTSYYGSGAGGATGKTTISVSAGTFSIAWTSTLLRDLLGFTANITAQTSATTSLALRGQWLPDCPLFIDGGHLDAAPTVTDLQQSESPDGLIIGHVGNSKYRHRGVRWSQCPSSKIWIADEVTFGESLEQFLTDTQWGMGHSWFSPSSKVRIMAHTGALVGESYVDGWYMKGVASMDDVVKRVSEGWDGLWRAEVREIVTNQ